MTAVNVVRTFFAPILLAYPFLVYFGTYISIIICGNVVSVATLWLAFQGKVEIIPFVGVVALVLFSDISGDQAWYWLGRGLRGTKLGSFLYRKLPKREYLESHIRRQAERWIYLSKFIPSSTFPIIFLAGWSDVPFRKFLRSSLAAIGSSTAVLVLLAYGFSLGLSTLEPTAFFRRFERLFLLGIVIFLALNFLAVKLSRRILRREEP